MGLPYQMTVRPALFNLFADPESAHEFALEAMELAQRFPSVLRLLHSICGVYEPGLAVNVAGMTFQNPIGLAAGFDKNVRVVPFMQSLGFGFLEVGTITPYPQVGKKRPRIHRFPSQEAMINLMGFPNDGGEVATERLRALRRSQQIKVPLGINIGPNSLPEDAKTKDNLDKVQRDFGNMLTSDLVKHADYIVVNVSSPNTPGLREMQAQLRLLLPVVMPRARGKPVFVKLAPDLSQADCEDATEAAIECKAKGLILFNTTKKRDGMPPAAQTMKDGGLSGKPVFNQYTEPFEHCVHAAAGRLDIIYSGGVRNAYQVLERLEGGAKAVQVYSSLIYDGPLHPRKILVDLARMVGMPDIRHRIAAGHLRLTQQLPAPAAPKALLEPPKNDLFVPENDNSAP